MPRCDSDDHHQTDRGHQRHQDWDGDRDNGIGDASQVVAEIGPPGIGMDEEVGQRAIRGTRRWRQRGGGWQMEPPVSLDGCRGGRWVQRKNLPNRTPPIDAKTDEASENKTTRPATLGERCVAICPKVPRLRLYWRRAGRSKRHSPGGGRHGPRRPTTNIELLCALRSSAEFALHQAIYEAKEDGCSWRMLGHYTDMSWQTLRRYRGKPLRMPPPMPEAAREERRQRRRPRRTSYRASGD